MKLQQVVDIIKIKDVVLKIAEMNNVNIVRDDSTVGIFSIGVEIKKGVIYIRRGYVNWLIVLHELCHILTVEPEYRNMVDYDTVKSYKRINTEYGFAKNRTEGATLALQHLIQIDYDFIFNIVSDFHSGVIGGEEHNLKSDWLEAASTRLSLINIPYNDTCIKFDIVYRYADIFIDSFKPKIVYIKLINECAENNFTNYYLCNRYEKTLDGYLFYDYNGNVIHSRHISEFCEVFNTNNRASIHYEF